MKPRLAMVGIAVAAAALLWLLTGHETEPDGATATSDVATAEARRGGPQRGAARGAPGDAEGARVWPPRDGGRDAARPAGMRRLQEEVLASARRRARADAENALRSDEGVERDGADESGRRPGERRRRPGEAETDSDAEASEKPGAPPFVERPYLIDEKLLPPEPLSEVPHDVRVAWDDAPDLNAPGDKVRFELEVDPLISDAELQTLVLDVRARFPDTPFLIVKVRALPDPATGRQGPVLALSRNTNDGVIDTLTIRNRWVPR